MQAPFLIQIVFLFVGHLVMPAVLLYSLWKSPEDTRFRWLLKAMYTGAFLAFMFLIGRWDWRSYFLRHLWVLVYAVVLVISYRGIRKKPWGIRHDAQTWGHLLTLVVFLGLLGLGAKGFSYSDRPVRLAFPLRDGWYYVAHGGNGSLLNHHNVYEPQKYALDIVALNSWGARASGIYPADVSRYEIWNEVVHSPCDGTVTKAADGLTDQIPPQTDPDHPAGNHLVIRCEGVNVLLAHLQNGSLMVKENDQISTGQPLARVGNSGNTTEPHLHVHAVKATSPEAIEGEGVPILFRQRFPVRNTVFLESGTWD